MQLLNEKHDNCACDVADENELDKMLITNNKSMHETSSKILLTEVINKIKALQEELKFVKNIKKADYNNSSMTPSARVTFNNRTSHVHYIDDSDDDADDDDDNDNDNDEALLLYLHTTPFD
ncbi:hypothetical protein PV328_011279 [Microctonus aethiopoides]|uniref:Uncharacterized protein n=1 Tax=Microctonus aethiopoides TaxID=144406 RepID=A0AA39C508_9HYME|nr:hypothetical protein PV328_011279 [Microctonus aethiopoides]